MTEIIKEIQSTSSSLGKMAILQKYKNNNEFKQVLYFLLNPFITTGLSTKKINKNVTFVPMGIDTIYDAMEYVKNNNTGTDEVIGAIQYFLNNNKDNIELYKAILTKSLKLGVTSKTVNKVYGKDFIPSFECMLAEKYFDKPNFINGKSFTVTLKIDGQRCLAIKENGNVSLMSRQGQPIEDCVDIVKELKELPVDNVVFDGELTLLNDTDMCSKDKYKETLKITRKIGEKHNIKLLVFDFLRLNEFKTQQCNHIYTDRRKMLESMPFSKFIEILPVLYNGVDENVIIPLLSMVRNNNEEGIMINIDNAMYQFKRTSNLLKCKVMQDCDLEIIGFEEGQGKLTGTLGRVNVNYKGNILGVGGGFTNEDRKFFWENKDKLLGRVITVQYFEETQDKDGKYSLRFPVFKELREIGKEVSYA